VAVAVGVGGIVAVAVAVEGSVGCAVSVAATPACTVSSTSGVGAPLHAANARLIAISSSKGCLFIVPPSSIRRLS
jgi:hypothetical protein